MWTHFKYEDGSNPYIAKTEEETNRIKNKYKEKCIELKEGFYLIRK